MAQKKAENKKSGFNSTPIGRVGPAGMTFKKDKNGIMRPVYPKGKNNSGTKK